ncbi:MAG: cold shock domain-containing protein [bacterium]|nr:cold shock domain-containing protein [bacterium]
MADSFSKKEKEKKRAQKKKLKAQKKEERQANAKSGDLDDMIAYVDEFGNITDTPPDPDAKKEEIDAESIEIGIPKREESDEDGFVQGRVAFFNDAKGFGFINEIGSGERFFVHSSGLKEPIKEGDKVAFKPIKGAKGMDATEVKKV